MSHVFDWRTGGVLPLWHIDYDNPREGGAPFKEEVRGAVLVARINGRIQQPPRPHKWWIRDGDWADLTGAVFWRNEPDKRRISGASWAWPSIVVDDGAATRAANGQEKFGRDGGIKVRPVTIDKDAPGGLQEDWFADERYSVLPTGVPRGWPKPAAGTIGITGLASDEGRHNELFIWADPRLVAPHRGGTREMGSVLSDVTPAGEIDPVRYGHAQTLLRVVHLDGQFQWGLNVAPSVIGGGGDGVAYIAADGSAGGIAGADPDPNRSIVAGGPGAGPGGAINSVGIPTWLSYERGGPLIAGHRTSDKHKQGTNIDGESEQPAHIWWKFKLYKNIEEDGPLDITEYKPGGNSQRIVKVYFGWDTATQLWRWWTTVPIIPPPWIPWNEPVDGIRITTTDSPVYRKNPDGLWIPFPRPGAGEPTEIGGGRPTNPSKYEQELAVTSLMINGVRHRDSMPGSGQLGGDGQDTDGAIDGEGRSSNGGIDVSVGGLDQNARAETTSDSFADRLRQVEKEFENEKFDGTGRGADTGLSGTDRSLGTDFGHTKSPGDPNFELDNDNAGFAGENTTYANSLAASDIRKALDKTRRGRRDETIPGRLGSLSPSAIERGGPIPLTAHIWGLPRVNVGSNGVGTWDYLSTSHPGEHYGDGVASGAAMIIGQGGVIPDGIDDQSAHIGDLCALLYNGNLGGNPVECFGWGQYDQTDGTVSDGAVFSLTGSSGTRGMKVEFKDTSGANQDETFCITGGLELVGVSGQTQNYISVTDFGGTVLAYMNTSGDLYANGYLVAEQTFTDPTTATIDDEGGEWVIVTTTTSGGTIALPASPSSGRLFRIKNDDASTHSFSVTTNGKQVDGSTAARTVGLKACLVLRYNGTKWHLGS